MQAVKDRKTKTLNKRGTLIGLEPKRKEYVTYKSGKGVVYIFDCIEKCGAELRIQGPAKIKNHTGKCASCVQRGRPYEAMYNELYNRAKINKKEVTITYEEFYEMCKKDVCHYCGCKLNRKPYTKEKGKDVEGSRAYMLDRKDNNKGYSIDNVVNCCWTCNSGKGNRYTYSQWYGMNKFIRDENQRKLELLYYYADRD